MIPPTPVLHPPLILDGKPSFSPSPLNKPPPTRRTTGRRTTATITNSPSASRDRTTLRISGPTRLVPHLIVPGTSTCSGSPNRFCTFAPHKISTIGEIGSWLPVFLFPSLRIPRALCSFQHGAITARPFHACLSTRHPPAGRSPNLKTAPSGLSRKGRPDGSTRHESIFDCCYRSQPRCGDRSGPVPPCRA